jgi:hypothetical protein
VPARKSTFATSAALSCSVLAASSDLPPHQQATILHFPTRQQDAVHIPLTIDLSELMTDVLERDIEINETLK